MIRYVREAGARGECIDLGAREQPAAAKGAGLGLVGSAVSIPRSMAEWTKGPGDGWGLLQGALQLGAEEGRIAPVDRYALRAVP